MLGTLALRTKIELENHTWSLNTFMCVGRGLEEHASNQWPHLSACKRRAPCFVLQTPLWSVYPCIPSATRNGR